MNWAWQLTLSPTQKLVLMALADAADDQGICWPSIHTIARKCSISERTGQRIVAELIRRGLLNAQARYKSDGSRTSNRYRLALDTPPDKLSPPTATNNTAPRHQHAAPPDNTDVVTTNITINQPPQPVGYENNIGGGNLLFAKSLSAAQVDEIRIRLAALNYALAQQVLDELAGRLKMNEVRNPIRYCSTLIDKALKGELTPELGIKVAETRQIHIARESQRIAAALTVKVEANHAVSDPPKAFREMLASMKSRSPR